MKAFGYIFLTLIILLLSTVPANSRNKKKKSKKYISITKESKLKKYNPHAVWTKTKCKHCDGKGFKIKQKYNAKKNKMIKTCVPCPYCKGKGYTGMSKR